MKADTQMIHISDDLTMPWDLRQWFPAATLRKWITEEIGSLDWNNPQVAEFLRQRAGFQPQTLLCLLTYAYATAVFESEELARQATTDPEFQAILGERLRLDGRGLVRFRRENRGLLKWALVQVFKRALRARLGEIIFPAGLKRRLVDAAVTRIDLGRQMDRGHDGLE